MLYGQVDPRAMQIVMDGLGKAFRAEILEERSLIEEFLEQYPIHNDEEAYV